MKAKTLLIVLMITAVCVGVLRASIKDIEHKAEVKETIVSFSPKIELILPNGAMDLKLKQKYVNTLIEFQTKYDYLDNYIFSDLDMSYLFDRTSFGLDLSDKVDFEELFAQRTTLQRIRRVTPYVGYNLTDKVKLTFYNRFGNSYTVLLDSNTVLESGKDVKPGVNLMYSSIDESGELTKGIKASIDVGKSFAIFGGEFDYTQAEATLHDFTYLSDKHHIETNVKIGYPLSLLKKPVTEIYGLGGFDMLRGYKIKEFEGDSMEYLGLKYRFPLILKRDFMNLSLDVFSVDLQYEIGKTGTKEIFDTFRDMKSSFGFGAGFDLTFFETVKTKLNASVNQAMESRSPEFYFSIYAVSYLMK
ncbi:MAG: BamA/TamA family outer membrane protein [Elusimicrobiota bacterium]